MFAGGGGGLGREVSLSVVLLYRNLELQGYGAFRTIFSIWELDIWWLPVGRASSYTQEKPADNKTPLTEINSPK